MQKPAKIRFRIETDPLYRSDSKTSSFKVDMFEVDGNTRSFAGSHNITWKERRTNRKAIFNFFLGHFDTTNKDLEFDVYDSEGTLVNTYSTTISAINLASQVPTTTIKLLQTASCPTESFGDCHLQYILDNIKIEARPQKQITSRVIKTNDGRYKITVPVPRRRFGIFKSTESYY